jgi:hypothetical protein
MERFIARVITREQAEQGYNNEGRGELLGYIAVPSQHEETCRYRISTGGNPDKKDRESCTCRIGLWQEKTPAQKVVDQIRKTSPARKKTKAKKAVKATPKSKAKVKGKTKKKPTKNPARRR